MALAVINTNIQRVGTGNLYLAAAPTSDPGSGTLATSVDGYYALFYGSAGKAAKKTLDTGIVAWSNITANGMNLKVKPAFVEFDPNNAPKSKVLAGIDEATVEWEFYDVNPDHLKDVFGLAAGDLIAVTAASGVAGRKIAAVGANANMANLVAMYRMPSALISGEYDHFMFPLVNLMPEIDVKLSKKDAVTVKVSASLRPSPYAKNAADNGVFCVFDAADAAATA